MLQCLFLPWLTYHRVQRQRCTVPSAICLPNVNMRLAADTMQVASAAARTAQQLRTHIIFETVSCRLLANLKND